MTPRIEKTVFISYRRTNIPWAIAIYQNLTSQGYDVFFDYLSIDSGNFENVIIENIKTRAHFIIILTTSALERCNEPGDWLRREIETAIDERRNIVPLMLESFDFGSPLVKQTLTGKLATLNQYNGLRVPSEYFLEAMDRLRSRYLNVAVGDIVLSPLNSDAQNATESQKKAASEALPVDKDELTSQELYERGYKFYQSKDYDEALRLVNDAISLQPDNEYFYLLRGGVLAHKQDLESAMDDYNKLINLNPNNADYYLVRGLAWQVRGNNNKALDDYDKAIDINPSNAKVYMHRANLKRERGLLETALEDYNKTLSLNPNFHEAYFNRGGLQQLMGNLNFAVQDYEESIRINPDYGMATISLIGVLRKLGRKSEADKREKMARELIKGETEYNQACFESVSGNFDKAFFLLKVGLEKEQVTKEWARKDPDLENIRGDPRFKELVGE